METIVGGGPRRVIPARPVFRSLHLKPEEPIFVNNLTIFEVSSTERSQRESHTKVQSAPAAQCIEGNTTYNGTLQTTR